jgi:hypothetical protein
MSDDLIESCRRRIDEEERLVRAAPNPEAAELHVQKVQLYRAQLATLQRLAQTAPPTVA